MPKLQSRIYKIIKLNKKGETITTIKESFSISISQSLVQQKGWKKGDDIIDIPTDRGIELVRTSDL